MGLRRGAPGRPADGARGGDLGRRYEARHDGEHDEPRQRGDGQQDRYHHARALRFPASGQASVCVRYGSIMSQPVDPRNLTSG